MVSSRSQNPAPDGAGAGSFVGQEFQGGVKTQASGAHQTGAERFGLVVGKGAGKAAGDFMAAGERSHERIGKLRMLVGPQLALPGAGAAGVGAFRPEIGTAAEKPAVAQDQDAAVATPDAVKHMHVNRIKPVLHAPENIARGLGCRASRTACRVSQLTKPS